jgi:autotransporter-associated beta strand protein
MGTGGVTLGANRQVTVSAHKFTVGGAITGAFSLTKAGNGTFNISNASNAWTGATAISAGTLQLGGNNAIPTGAGKGDVSVSSTLDLNSYSVTINGLNGAGTVNDVTGAGTPTFTVGNNGVTSSFSGQIKNSTGTVALTKTGAGALTLSGANTYGGTTTLSAGTLVINNATAIGSGTFTIGGVSTIDNTSGSSITLSNNNTQNWNGDFSFTGTNDLNMGTGAVTLGATRTVTVTNGNLTVGGIIGDGGNVRGIIKAGAGILTLTGTNTFTGDLVILAGTVSGNSSQAFGASGTHTAITLGNTSGSLDATVVGSGAVSYGNYITVANGNTGKATISNSANCIFVDPVYLGTTGTHDVYFTSTNSNSLEQDYGFSGSGGNIYLNATGSGVITLGLSNGTFPAYLASTFYNVGVGTATNVLRAGLASSNLGVIQNSSTSAITVSGDIALNTPTTLTNNGGALLSVTGAVNGAGSLVCQNNTSTANAITISGSGVSNAAVSNTGTGTGATLISAVIGGTSTMLQNSATSPLTLTNTNTYSGTTTISAGTISANATAALGNGGGTNTLIFNTSGGTLQAAGTITSPATRAVTLTSAGTFDNNGNAISIAGNIGGAGELTKMGAGTLTLSGTNNYTGPTTVNGGTLAAGSTTAFGTNSAMTLNNNSGAGIDITGFNNSIGSLTGGGGTGGNVTLGGATLTIGGDGTSPAAYGGAISGTGGKITKTGAGTLTLSGNSNSYTGGTTVGAGTLLATNTSGSATGTGSVTLNSGTYGTLGGTGIISGAVDATNGTLTPGISGPGKLTTTAASATALTMNASSVLNVDVGTLSDTIACTGAASNVTIAGTVNASAAAGFAAGTYVIITCTGAIGGSFTTVNVPGGYSGSISVNNAISPRTVSLVITTNTKEWKSATSGDPWNTAGNWNPNGVPASNAGWTIVYDNLSTANPMTQNQNDASANPLVISGFIVANNVGGGDPNINAGNPLSLTGYGIDMSASNKNFTIGVGVTVAGNQNWNVINGKLLTASGAVTLTNNLTINSGGQTGTVLLSAANGGAGTITISGGTLQVGNATSMGTNAGSTTISSGATLDLNGINYSTTEPLSISGTGVGANGALVNSAVGAATFAGPVTLLANTTVGANGGNITLSGIVSGSYGLTLVSSGAKVLALSNNGNSYTGATTVTTGTLQLGAANVVPDGVGKGDVTVNGTLDMHGVSETINGLNGSGAVDNSVVAATTITVGNNNATSSFSGALKNTSLSLALVKTGTGTLTLSGTTSTYSGGTTISGGTLLATNASGSATGTAGVAVNAGGTLAGTGFIGGLVTVANNATAVISPGNGGAGTLTLSGGITLNANSTLSYTIGASTPVIAVNAGNLALTGTLNVTAAAGFATGTYTIMTYTGSLTSNTLVLGSTPVGSYTINTATANQIKLVVNKTNWSLTALGTINGGAIGSSVIYVGAGSPDILYCRSLANGNQMWSYATGHGACHTPSYYYNGTNYQVVASAIGWVIGQQDNGGTSSNLWAAGAINLAGAGTPYISTDGTSFYVPYTGYLTKRKMSDGSSQYLISVPFIDTAADLVVASDYVYTAATNGYVNRYDAADLTVLTQYGPITGNPRIDPPLLKSPFTTLYVTPNNGTLISLPTSTMTPANWTWSYSQGGSNTGAAFLTGTNVYTAAGNYVYKIIDNGSSATESWHFGASGTVNSGPIYYNSRVYFGCNGGIYYAIDDASHTACANWPYTSATGNASTGPWIDATNGQVIFGTTGGNLDAIPLAP